jgi:hypothetical protein
VLKAVCHSLSQVGGGKSAQQACDGWRSFLSVSLINKQSNSITILLRLLSLQFMEDCHDNHTVRHFRHQISFISSPSHPIEQHSFPVNIHIHVFMLQWKKEAIASASSEYVCIL